MSRHRRTLLFLLAVTLITLGFPAHACPSDGDSIGAHSPDSTETATLGNTDCPFHASKNQDGHPEPAQSLDSGETTCCPDGCSCGAPAPVPITVVTCDASPDHSASIAEVPHLTVTSLPDTLLRPPKLPA